MLDSNALVQEAFKALKNSYSPYSHYPVGAALQTKDGKIYYGANIENAAYGSTVCAERNAIFNAYSNGVRKDDIHSLAIVCEGETLGYPCGACRQVLSELMNEDVPIYLSNHKLFRETNLKEIMPYTFSDKDLI